MEVRRSHARKLWVPYGGLRWPPPRLAQLARRALCAVLGHDWSAWTVDDYDGPGEYMPGGGFMPYTSREARPDEPYAIRVCQRDCGVVERRA